MDWEPTDPLAPPDGGSGPAATSSSQHNPNPQGTESENNDNTSVPSSPLDPSLPIKLRDMIDEYAWGIFLSTTTSLKTYTGPELKAHLIRFVEDASKPLRIVWNPAKRKLFLALIDEALVCIYFQIKEHFRTSVTYCVRLKHKRNYVYVMTHKKNSVYVMRHMKKFVYVMVVDPSKRTNILDLTKELIQVSRTGFNPTTDLCARVAYMRYVYLQDQSQYWRTLDRSLSEMYQAANNDPMKIKKIFRDHLEKDRREHAVNRGSMPVPVYATHNSKFQDHINFLIQAGVPNALNAA